MEEERATRMLERRGFNVDVIEDTTTPAEPGMVLRQSPEAGTEQPQGSTVVITVSRYEEPEPTEEPSPTEGEPSPTEELSPTDEPSPTEDATESLGTGP